LNPNCKYKLDKTPTIITIELYKKGNSNLKIKYTIPMVKYCPTIAIHLRITKVFLSNCISDFEVKTSENFIQEIIYLN
tara:strand:- start:4811 stop:5044 length:234 start_codon:yes stop_codon:yes gene_type:complete